MPDQAVRNGTAAPVADSAVLAILMREDDPVTAAELARRLDVHTLTVAAALSHLEDAGKARIVCTGAMPRGNGTRRWSQPRPREAPVSADARPSRSDSERPYALTITGLTLEQAKTLYASHIGCAYGDLIPGDEIPDMPTSYTGRARAFWTSQQDVFVDIRPVDELAAMAESIARRAILVRP